MAPGRPRHVVHVGPRRALPPRFGQQRDVMDEQAIRRRRCPAQERVERRRFAQPPGVGEAVALASPIRLGQHEAAFGKQAQLVREDLAAFLQQGVDPRLDGQHAVPDDAGADRDGDRPPPPRRHFLSLVQTRSMSLVAASGQAGVNAILMSAGTFSSGASFMAGS